MLWSNSTETVAFNNNWFFKDHFDEDKKTGNYEKY